MFRKILVANRGEIAVRIIKAARSLGIRSVVVYASSEKEALPAQMADEAYDLGEGTLTDTYLNIDSILDIARKSQCDALHPGYGFLSENPRLVKACEEHHITFIGPSSKAMQLMGNKIEARHFVKSIGVPVIEGVTGEKESLLQQSSTFSYPVLVKAAAGGGGKGMRIVRDALQLPHALEATSREAQAYFGDGTVYIEKYLEEPRHIEIQLLADQHGHAVHLFERECSLQRRYQKIIEEAPSPTLDEALRQQMGAAAVRIAQEIQYTNAGTIEFLLDKDRNFYFLEMNTRVQVEHPVTEMTTGVDIVAEQIRIAAGEPLAFTQDALRQQGHAIECRIYAESPENQFLPSPGTIQYYHPPAGEGIRLDTAIQGPTLIDSRYDPMIGKLIAYGKDRHAATRKMISALKDYAIQGIDTNISFLIQLLESEAFQKNLLSTKYCDQHTPEILEAMAETKKNIPLLPLIAGALLFEYPVKGEHADSLWQQIGFWRLRSLITFTFEGQEYQGEWKKIAKNTYSLCFQEEEHRVFLKSSEGQQYRFLVEEQPYSCFISENEDGSLNITHEGFSFFFRRNDILGKENFVVTASADPASDNKLLSPMPGKVIKIHVQPGDQVHKGDTLLIVEAMKMENTILAPRDAHVSEIYVSEQEMVERNKPLILLS